MKKRILITGANGFIGRNVIQALQEYDNVEIIALVRSKQKSNLIKQKKPC